MRIFAVVIMLAAAGCATPQRWYVTETGERRAIKAPVAAPEQQHDQVEEEKPRRRRSACERCEEDRFFCRQANGFRRSADIMTGREHRPEPCPECYTVCAMEGQ